MSEVAREGGGGVRGAGKSLWKDPGTRRIFRIWRNWKLAVSLELTGQEQKWWPLRLKRWGGVRSDERFSSLS